MSDSVVLYEHRESEKAVQLSADERDALTALVPQLTISPAPGSDREFLLNPRNAVGVAQIRSRRFELRPKLAIRRLAFVLAYSMDPSHWRQSGFDFEEAPDIYEAVLPGFAFQLEEALRAGPLFGYRHEEDALQTVRGRIRFEDQLRVRFGVVPPVECRFDDFTEDIEINRILKAAIARFGRIRLRSESTRKRLRSLNVHFRNVSDVQYQPSQVPAISWNRLNDRFRPATELARLVLRSRSFDLRGGEVGAAAFLLDMSEVFENFIVVALREALRLTPREFPQEAHGLRLHLDAAKRLRLKPDLSWWEGGACVFVGDVKYKRTPEVAGVVHPDVYQLLAYTTALNLQRGLLVYAAAAGESEGSYRIIAADKELETVSLDLDQDPETVLDAISRIADRIRGHASLAKNARALALAA